MALRFTVALAPIDDGSELRDRALPVDGCIETEVLVGRHPEVNVSVFEMFPCEGT